MTASAFDPLIAKSRGESESTDPPTIEEHCLAVREAAEAIWDAIEPDLAAILATDRAQLRSTLRPLFLISALLHDVAKANCAFQALAYRADRKKQPIRHEVLAAMLLTDERFWGKWLEGTLPDPRDRWAVVWAVAGHHLQLRRKRFDDTEDPVYRTGNIPRRVAIYTDHSQVLNLLREACRCADARLEAVKDVPTVRLAPFDSLDGSDDGLASAARRFVGRSDVEWRRFRQDETFKLRVAILKALLIAADVAGSALVGENKNVPSSIRTWLRLGLQPADARKIYESNLNGKEPYDFQRAVACSQSPVTIVAAACGHGKTTAAYMWAEKWAKGRKLFFAYPTTGTASAGFKEYLFAQTELERTLIHSRAEADLKSMWGSSPDDESPIERAQRLDSLRAWGQQVIACTVDTVLGLMQNQRRPLFGFPAIARGAFVFDEVHSYDRRLFAELLRFLETFPGAPVLIMSASIPPNRLQALKRAAAGRINEQPIQGVSEVENVKRYRISWQEDIDACWREVATALAKGQKVLWVCNTVNDAIQVFRKAEQLTRNIDGLQTILYHSRFRYGGNPPLCSGRVELQRRVLDEFAYEDEAKTRRVHARPAIVVATQVCEMSLNISADMLISALCPLPSLVQRLGRLNRFATTDDPKPALVYDFAGRPYHEDDYPRQLQAAHDMITELEGNACSQATLAEYVNRMQLAEDWSETLYSAWLDGGWESDQRPAREIDNSITLVREEDLRFIGKKPRPHEVIPWTITMLYKRGFTWSQQVCGYPIAPAGTVLYDWDEKLRRGYGASWADGQFGKGGAAS